MQIRRYWRKWLRVLHRDLGYFFFGATVVYGLSGLALNHMDDWNPSYLISHEEFQLDPQVLKEKSDEAGMKQLLKDAGVDARYKKHYRVNAETLRVFVKNGSGSIDTESGKLSIEWVKRRPVFFTVNKLHYNPGHLWTWFSDIFAGALIFLAVSGLFMLKGRNGITRRGGILVALGLIVPGVLAYLSL